MARFYANIQGNRGEATRMGTPSSGIGGHIRGWDLGVEVSFYVDENGKDAVAVYRTGGSNSPSRVALIGRFCEGDSK